MAKKGKQRGVYKTKGLRIAANRLQWDDTNEDLRSKYNSKCSNNGYKRCLEITRLRNSMDVVTRMLVPTEGDEMRLRRMCNPVNILNTENNSYSKGNVIKKKRHSIGWVLGYSGEKEDVLKRKRKDDPCIPSLSRLCIDALAKVLPMYTKAIEFDDLKTVLGSLGPHALAMLSACVEVDDNLALLLGQHVDLDCLVLKSKSNKLTDKAINGLTPRLLNASGDADDCKDWEETINEPEVIGCMNLRRLELLDAQAISFEAMGNFLRFSPCITHLSISNSFDNVTGPRLLLDDSSNLFSLLPRLQLLDLSHCSWLDDSILAHTFSRLLDESHRVLNTLILVSVSGCPKVTKACLRKLNEALFPSKIKPVLCTEVYVHSIVHQSMLGDSVAPSYSLPRMDNSFSPIEPPGDASHWWDFVQ